MAFPAVTKPRLISQLFHDNDRLQKCLKIPLQHVVPGSRGEHVGLVQQALIRLEAAVISATEISNQTFGPSTLQAVRTFKGPPRNIINRSYQNAPDDIVGQMTIERLDGEMDALEKSSTKEVLVAADDFGAPHDHSKCALPSTDGEIEVGADGTMSHVGTPMNPEGFGRKINIGGAKETDYLGFQDFVPDPKLDPNMKGVPINGRGLTSSIPKHTVSDICFRSAPLDHFMRREIKRICFAGARLTFVGPQATDPGLLAYLRQVGLIIETGFVPGLFARQGRKNDRAFVVAMVLVVNRNDEDPF